MKKIFLIITTLLISFSGFSQIDSTLPQYRRFPVLPSFNLLLTDSITYYTKADLPKEKPVLFMLFDPNCDHCQHEAEEILKNIDSLRNIEIVMVTNADFADLKKFYIDYKLGQFKNIVAGIEPNIFSPHFSEFIIFPFWRCMIKKGN